MDDISFTETEEFKSLEGQRPGPSRERIFEKSEFDTRSYELVQFDEAVGASGSDTITHLSLQCSKLMKSRPSTFTSLRSYVTQFGL